MNSRGDPSTKHARKDDDGKADLVNVGIDQEANKEEAKKEDASEDDKPANGEKANKEPANEEHASKEALPNPYTMLAS